MHSTDHRKYLPGSDPSPVSSNDILKKVLQKTAFSLERPAEAVTCCSIAPTTVMMMQWFISSLNKIECTSCGLSAARFDNNARRMLKHDSRKITNTVAAIYHCVGKHFQHGSVGKLRENVGRQV
jgi:hypothetical protein